MKAEIIAEHKADILKEGAQAAGYKTTRHNPSPSPHDILIAWNRKPANESRIKFYENAGAKVLIAENGYIGRDDSGNKLIALAHNHHLGLGRWFVGDEPRYKKQNFKIEPWRANGEHILILAQRGIGNSKKYEWYLKLSERIGQKTSRPIRLRAHPGKNPSPIYPALAHAHAVVTWSSAAALVAIAHGVPAFYLLNNWIGAGMAKYGIDDLENPYLGDREGTFHRIGWAQWTRDEIRSGEAIRKVMGI